MDRADEKFAVINLDLPGRVFFLPKGSANLDLADLMHMAGKARQLTAGEVDIPATGDAPADSVYVTILRRRRR